MSLIPAAVGGGVIQFFGTVSSVFVYVFLQQTATA